MQTLGERIRELRKAAVLSQAELGRRAGVTGSTVSQLESGLSHALKAQTMLRTAKALQVAPSDFMEALATEPHTSEDERQMPALYRARPAGDKDIAMRLLKVLK